MNIIYYNYVTNLEAISDKSIDEMNEKEMIAKLTSIIRFDRFCVGYIADALEKGIIQDILTKLNKT